MRKITEIILHCSATPEGKDYKAADIDRWHRNNGWKCIGYNFVIDIDGTIENGRDIEDIPAHCSGHNKNSVGICYIGGCDKNMKAKDTRTDAQKISLYKVVYEMMKKYNLPITCVYTHAVLCNYSKACPSFKQEDFRKEMLEWIKSNDDNYCPYCGHKL